MGVLFVSELYSALQASMIWLYQVEPPSYSLIMLRQHLPIKGRSWFDISILDYVHISTGLASTFILTQSVFQPLV